MLTPNSKLNTAARALNLLYIVRLSYSTSVSVYLSWLNGCIADCYLGLFTYWVLTLPSFRPSRLGRGVSLLEITPELWRLCTSSISNVDGKEIFLEKVLATVHGQIIAIIIVSPKMKPILARSPTRIILFYSKFYIWNTACNRQSYSNRKKELF